MDYTAVSVIVCNLGAVIYIAIKVVDKVDRHQEILPKLVEALENVNKSSAQHLGAIQDLYEQYHKLSNDFHELVGEHKARRVTDREGC